MSRYDLLKLCLSHPCVSRKIINSTRYNVHEGEAGKSQILEKPTLKTLTSCKPYMQLYSAVFLCGEKQHCKAGTWMSLF